MKHQELPGLQAAKLHLAERSQVDSTRRCRCRCRRRRRWHNQVSRPLTSSKMKKITLSPRIWILQIGLPKRFMRKYGENLSKRMLLRVSNGAIHWPME
ncbi:hypothetical protein EUGRSUZ_G00679 [Eucalyptus grandis]|uniref:Uncharacterized protein n=2 Tax=Eucalyptus grandis TaxID=71139 RepID=A0ACC3K0T3_EUCGR|nr:hypothetical protein EUGRSUZ_G00679 [Eucalyptus grandis]